MQPCGTLRRIPPFTPEHSSLANARRCSTVVSVFLNKSGKANTAEPGLYNTMAKVNVINKLASSHPTLVKDNALEPKRFANDMGERVGLICTKDVQQDGVILAIPETLAVTTLDAEKQETIGPIVSSNCSELVALTLWLMAERAKGAGSEYATLLSTLPERTNSPLLWSDAELEALLKGSPVLEESRTRITEMKRQWQELHDNWFSKDTETFREDVYGYEQFSAAFCVVLAHTTYLPSAQMFAILPLASLMGRTGNGNGAFVDYDEGTGRVVVTAGRPYREGQEVLLNDERPNGELLMVTGSIPESNMSDFLYFPASLLAADRYFIMKSQILESIGFSAKDRFPVYADRMPIQLLAYIRLSRVQDPALFAKVSFEQDVVMSQMNEYEVLQLLMGDCRERLAEYTLSLEEDIKINQRQDLSVRDRLAAKLRLSEKRIISTTMDAVRKRLAPIRGIPTKAGGMQDVNSDLKEIFDAVESIPTAPLKILDGFMSWARGEQDPDWGKPANKNKAKRPW